MKMKIKMFTKTICPTCKIAKQQLSFLPVPVEIEEINIETSEEKFTYIVHNPDTFTGEVKEGSAIEFLTEGLDSMATPTFLFVDGTVIRGFEIGELMDKLGL